LLLSLTWQSGPPEIRSTAGRMEPYPQPDMNAVAALPQRGQEEVLDAIRNSIYAQPPTDWSEVSSLGTMRAVLEVKETVNLATQYVKAGYDPQTFIARLATTISPRCTPSVTSRSSRNTTRPASYGAGCTSSAAPGRRHLLRQEHDRP
jgi:hypothetical protein